MFWGGKYRKSIDVQNSVKDFFEDIFSTSRNIGGSFIVLARICNH
jgi:hypothetical protein